MAETESDIFLKQADDIVDKLMIALRKEVGEEVPPSLMMYVAAKLSAGVLLTLQEEGDLPSLADDFNRLVKKLMKLLKKGKEMSNMGDDDVVN